MSKRVFRNQARRRRTSPYRLSPMNLAVDRHNSGQIFDERCQKHNDH